MKYVFLAGLILLLCGCGHQAPPEPAQEVTLPPETVMSPPETEPAHSDLYIPGVEGEDVFRYFQEVALAAEFVHGGNPALVQKWEGPISVLIQGNPTEEDLVTLRSFFAELNRIEGFPGIGETTEAANANLRLYFCGSQELAERMGEDYIGLDGAVTFWYENNAIYDAIICIRTDLDQQLRNSVILEEFYNGLGPVQDTALRPDSIIWQEFSTPQSLTEVDWLLLKLLYHPEIKCGMNAQECEAVIRSLYD